MLPTVFQGGYGIPIPESAAMRIDTTGRMEAIRGDLFDRVLSGIHIP